MKIKLSMLALAFCAQNVFAQANNSTNSCYYYKWQEGGTISYGKILPHGKKEIACFNNIGYELDKNANSENIIILRPRFDDADAAPSQPQQNHDEGKSVEGTITVAQQCEIFTKEIKNLGSDKTVYEEDSQGNLVPLSNEQKSARKAEYEARFAQRCAQ